MVYQLFLVDTFSSSKNFYKEMGDRAILFATQCMYYVLSVYRGTYVPTLTLIGLSFAMHAPVKTMPFTIFCSQHIEST